ncbi:hypothetical protein ACTFIY_004603 [Dictyostelium cf. discoideum]
MADLTTSMDQQVMLHQVATIPSLQAVPTTVFRRTRSKLTGRWTFVPPQTSLERIGSSKLLSRGRKWIKKGEQIISSSKNSIKENIKIINNEDIAVQRDNMEENNNFSSFKDQVSLRNASRVGPANIELNNMEFGLIAFSDY